MQEQDVKLGRIQIFNNWSPYLLKDRNLFWLGLEYFCNENDQLWSEKDENLIKSGIMDLKKIGFLNDTSDVIDGTVIRMPKAYPAYFGEYKKFYIIREFVDTIENLFLIGRNGMHRYNNMDHSMMTAMAAVENIVNDVKTKDNIWAVNTETDYHETK